MTMAVRNPLQGTKIQERDTYTADAAPFVKWAGGKTQILPYLLQYIPGEYGSYIEPFIGGGALFYSLQPQKAILGDANIDLIYTYQVVKDNVEALIALLGTYVYNKDFYYNLRKQEPIDPVERAARFIYLNRTCFNGLYRVNKKDQFNVPMGSYKNPVICDAKRLKACSNALKSVLLIAGDYTKTIGMAQKGDFIYIDPPYHPVSVYSDFNRYTADFFYAEDQIKLRDNIDRLVKQGCKVLASNSYSQFILDLYADYTLIPVPARRNINSIGNKRSNATEVVIVCW